MRLTLVCLVLMLLPSWAQARWVTYEPLKNSPEYGPVVTDIERHLPAKHGFRDSDKITWTHEGTHGIAGQLRSKYRQPGFYLLEDRAFTLKQPKTTIAAVARKVPQSFRNIAYKNYCVDARPWWNTEPSYLIDEAVAYLNGSFARKELGIESRSETLIHLVDMMVCSTCIAYTTCGVNCGADCGDEDLKTLLRYLWEDTLLLVGKDYPSVVTLRTDADSADLYKWMKTYFGAAWVQLHFEGNLNYHIWN